MITPRLQKFYTAVGQAVVDRVSGLFEGRDKHATRGRVGFLKQFTDQASELIQIVVGVQCGVPPPGGGSTHGGGGHPPTPGGGLLSR